MSVHLVRHGEAENPGRIVYADLPGFGLSQRGRDEAEAAAQHLAELGVNHIYSSPLQRAQETAGVIARATGAPVTSRDDLVEWRLAQRWAGVAWEDLPAAFPGELEAYLTRPAELDFGPELLEGLAERIASAVEEVNVSHNSADSLVVVSHQDPIQAGRLALLGNPLSELHSNKPGHCDVITLVSGPWRELGHWQPQIPGPAPPAWPPVDGAD